MNCRSSLFYIPIFLCFKLVSFSQNEIHLVREHLLMDFGWRFTLGNACSFEKNFMGGTAYFTHLAKTGYADGAAAPQFEDRTWREVDLPHDWAIELPLSPEAGHSHGYRNIGWKFPQNSVGWYRKKFRIPNSDLGRKISIQLDGVHRNATVFINGFYLGKQNSGYTSTVYDLTDYLNYGAENTIAIEVNAVIEEGWFYEGAGIYRHVWLNKTDRLHVANNGTFITTEINDEVTDLSIRSTIENNTSETANFTLEQTLWDAENKAVASVKNDNYNLKANLNNIFYQKINLRKPKLWSLENPYLYLIETKVLVNGQIKDTYKTKIGIRTVRFDPNEGFFLNGKNLKIKGTNNHQDHAGVGTAIPEALQEFRVLKLKEMGNNAIRTAHNPPTPELLDICDRVGMLILDENRLMGINQEHFDCLQNFMIRDRNHPSVILWSLGNEEWAIESNVKGARITKTMQEYAHKFDSSRAFTVAVSGGWDNGSGQTAEVMGYNYIVQGNIDEHHKKFPWQSGIGTEESNTIGTRGVYVDDRSNGRMKASERMPENVGTESGWKFYAARPFLAGLFYWTGFDYHGEAFPITWPAVNSQFGILDLCGFPKDIFYYLKSWWSTEPVIHIAPHWNWIGSEGKPIKVTIYSNAEDVELFLNKKSLGKKAMPVNGHLDWEVKYQAGTLLAKGFTKGKLTITEQVETTTVPAKIELCSFREELNADGEDVAIITIQIKDLKSRLVPTANQNISFSINGPGKIIGVGNGDPASHEAEYFIETVNQLTIDNFKFQISDETENIQKAAFELDDAMWEKAFINKYGSFKNDKNIFFRASFQLSDFNEKTIHTYFAKSIVDGQSIFLNGKLLAKGIKRNDPNQVYILDNSLLKKGKNVLCFTGEPFVKQTEWEELNRDPGTIKVFNPSPQWKRKTFNGLAQIIVKSSKQAGEIILTATSDGLIPATLRINSKKCKARPCTEDY